MDIPAPPATREWTVGVRLWVERAGQAILGKGRLELLEGIGRWHSISEAARQMKMSYRHAWLLVQSINEAAGEPLVVSSTGGTHGGGARLTALGQWTVTMFRGLQEDIPKLAAAHFPPSFSDSEPAGIHVAASVSLEEVLGQLVADYALRRPAVRVRFVFGAANELADHIVAGAPADLFLAADQRSMRLNGRCLNRIASMPCSDSRRRERSNGVKTMNSWRVARSRVKLSMVESAC